MQFADGYAQAVTFGLLMARSTGIKLSDGLDKVGKQLGKTNSLIGAALRLLTDEVDSESTLRTSLRALIRVLDAVSWEVISKGRTIGFHLRTGVLVRMPSTFEIYASISGDGPRGKFSIMIPITTAALFVSLQ